MSDLRGLSRLPDDDAYWTDLEQRIVAGAVAPPTAFGNAPGWSTSLARYAWPLGAAAAAAAVACVLLVPPRTTAQAALLQPTQQRDPLYAVLVTAARPPAVGALLLGPQGGERE